MPTQLPTTPPAGPPNFYSQAGQMAAGGGGQALGSSAPQSGPGQNSPDDQAFLDNLTKLLPILDKLSTMKPKGQDVSKYFAAAAAPLKDCMQQVFGPTAGMPGQASSDGSVADSGSAGAASGPPPDTGAS